MNEPKRLFADASAFERSLLRAGRDDAPSRELEGKILATLEASSGPPQEELPRAARDYSLARVLSPRGLAAVAAVLGLGAAIAGAMTDSTPAPHADAPFANVAVQAPATPPPVPDEPPQVATVTPESLPSAPSPAASAPAPATAALVPAPAEAGASLEREIALLDAVKASLGAGNATEAARALDTYDAEIPRGALRPEATVLRIRTLLLQGNRAAANAMADELLAKNPNSVHGARIRALLAR